MSSSASPASWYLGPRALQKRLAALPLPAWRFYDVVGSTNDVALQWAAQGAAEGCLVIADAQTQGRGRSGSRWWTTPQASLAVSLIARPLPTEREALPRFTAWAALALAEALAQTHGLQAAIKWPNDVLLEGRKVAGVLAETLWDGNTPQAVIVGIGVNLATQAVPPRQEVDFPATSVAHVLGTTPDRWALLDALLQRMLFWRNRLASQRFIRAWENRLAYRGEIVQAGTHQGVLLGLDAQGGLRLRCADGHVETLYALQGHLRPKRSPQVG
ncbi:MAG: biotin--[acetyl-CoA-carboxylase] ligase [Chloroflexi bacterium]|nr:biotin--[acetyl-CoA-carboxylase] ligase [Chloroflexota bacterium]